MPACATQEKIADQPLICNLFLPMPDTDLRDFLDEVENFIRFAPEIVPAIESDLDAHARKKKKLRLEDRRFFQSQTSDIPYLNIQEREILSEELSRRGIEAVREELLEKVLAYNFCRGILMRKRRQEKCQEVA